MNIERSLQLSIIVVAVLCITGCSELKKGSQVTNPVFIDVHPAGFTSASSPNFHGTAIQNSGWEMRTCRQCHGGTYSGTNAVSCVSSGCHVDASGNPKSPESCNTCHGTFSSVASDTVSWAPPRSIAGDTAMTTGGVGAHQFHLDADSMDLSNPVACNNCHSVPSSVYVPGHFDPSSRATVSFLNPLANTPSAEIMPSPAYDYQSLSCSNTFCHGNWRLQKSTSEHKFIYSDTVISGANFSPQWTGGDSQDACRTCHGMPPVGHQDYGTSVSTCTSCHYYDQSKQSGPLDKSIHINGKVDLYGREYSFR